MMMIGFLMVYYGLFKWPSPVIKKYHIDLTNSKPEIIEINPKTKERN